MYDKSASYYDRLNASFYDWQGHHERYAAIIQRHRPSARTLLDLGCGTGQYLQLFGRDLETTGLDLDERMLEVCRQRCPGAVLHRADMADFQLDTRFDVVVCLFGSISYVKTLDRLRSTIRCMASHLHPGGLVLIDPYLGPEEFRTGYVRLNTVEDEQEKILWMYTPKREGRIAIHDIHYLVGTPEEVRHFTEHHEQGLFSAAEYAKAIEDARLALLELPSDESGGAYVAAKGRG
jgi:SAM-dependent methyltransferase